ncbi:putative disease resistance RPP13-like protein 1 [Pyrus communis]|uniref:putative disease resistance RPP13-like protein 1 n=1 Tax=Pyrus communis TaxID=23211 RepID=UPI0035C0EB0F
MAELVGGAFLSSILNVLFDRMASRRFLDFISGKKNDNELLMRELKIKLLAANKLVDDAEEKQMTRPTVRTWLDDLKDAIYCVGELLDEINTEALRRQLEGDDEHSPAASSSTSWITRSVFKSSSPSDEFHDSLEPKISNILRVLDLILKEKDVLGLKEGVQHRPQDTTRQTTSRVDDSGVFGREKDRETILKSLRPDDTAGPKIGVLPIEGMGGIGKSTLAQLVYKDVKDDFDVQAWVCVGEELDILQIVQTIYGKITKKPCTITDLDLLSEELEEILTGKKFLFVLDDVWSEDYLLWENLMTHFNSYGVHGSKIIVTTRLGGVASITGTLSPHYLQEISEDDSWSLFAKHAFTEDSVIPAHPHLEVIGRKIVKKCQGLPLAIKSLGGLLHAVLNPKEWEKILKSDLWELPNDKVLPALWLSYQYLPPHLKRCFAYCAIFPKGYRFRSSKLISWWMAEDFLQPHGNEALEDVGSDYSNILVSRSFFQHSKEYGESYFTMHDLINDLAKFVSGEFCLRLEDDHLTVDRNICRVRHVSSMNFCNQRTQNLGALYEAKHLHGFLRLHSVHFIRLGNKPIDLLLVLPYLRVLKLEDRDIVELPSSIGDLKQLRHLDVSWTSITELPDKVCNLYNLQTLLLEFCRRLIQLPSELGRLINLRHLNIRGTKIKQMPVGMCNLKNLQTLSDFVVDKQTGQRIGELKELQHLRQDLRISGVGNIDHEGNALEADIMSNKEYLDELVLTWRKGDDDASNHDPENDREVLKKLQPHTNLKQIEIRSYGGLEFPGWLADPSFSKLSHIVLKDCKHCRLLPPLGRLRFLKDLCIEGINNVVEIDSNFYGNDSLAPFRSLEKLCLREMWNCQKWLYYDGSRGNTTILFPNLRKLELSRCPNLTEILPLEKLPRLERVELWDLESFSGSLAHVESECPKFLSLVHLEIENCPNFVCFPDGGMDAPKLEELRISQCKKLRSLPEQMHTLLPSLRILKVFDCPEVESYYDGSRGKTTILFPNLCELELSRCPKLTEMVPLEKLPRLERVKLRHLESFSGSLAHVESECPKFLSLVHLEIENCPNFVCFPDGGMDAPKLEELRISQCKKLRSLPEQMHTLLPSLRILKVFDCPEVESYYDGSRGNTTILFPNLCELELSRCPKLTEIVPLEKLPRLERVKLMHLESFSGSLAHVESECPKFLSLVHLEIHNCPNFVCFPDGGMDAPKLEELRISQCEKLRSLPEQMHTLLPSLRILEVFDCPEVESYYDGSRGNTTILFPNLCELELSICPKLTEIVPLEKLPRLERVKLRHLESFSGSLALVESECPKFLSLVHLEIGNCPNFVCFPDGGMDAPKLKELCISECKKLRSLPEQMHTLLPSLQKLEVFSCPEVEPIPQGGLPSNLQGLSFECCRKLAANRSLWGLTRLNSLRKLKINFTEEGGEEMGCSFPDEGLLPTALTHLAISKHPNLTTIQGKVLRQLTSLEELLIRGCPELQGLPEEAPKSLKSLTVWDCPNIRCLPGEWLPSSLSHLQIWSCPLLEERFRRGTREDWPKIAHIPYVSII